jgi:hypothetical protein
VLAPFIPVIIGGALKLALLDQVPEEAEARTAFLINSYAKPLWLQLLVSAYILPIAAIMSGTASKKKLTALYVIPALVFIVCLALFLGLPKFQVNDIFWNIYALDALAAICVIILGVILVWP